MLTATLTASSDSTSSPSSNTTGATFWQTVSDGSDASYAFGTDGGVLIDNWYFECGFTAMLASLAIASVTVRVRAKDGASIVGKNHVKGRVKIGATSYNHPTNSETTPTAANYDFVFLTDPSTSAAWTRAAINAATWGCLYDNTGYTPSPIASPEVYEVTVLVSYVPLPATVDVTRDVASRMLWLNRSPEVFGVSRNNLDALNVPLMGAIDLEHIAGPHPIDEGWGPESWQLRPFELHGQVENFDDMTVESTIKDQRRTLILLRDLAYSDRASGTIGEGIARFAVPGSTFNLTRAAEATFTNPAGESETVPPNFPAYADWGLQILAGANPDVCWWTNNSGARVLNAAQGGLACEFRFLGTLAQDRTILYGLHDASNWLKVWYDNTSSRLKFAIRAAGTTVTITSLAAPIISTAYQIGVAWTGSNLEYGLPARTMSLYINRVLQGTAQAAAVMTEAASSNLYIGCLGGATDVLRGQIRKIHSYAYVPSDVEMQRSL